MSGGHAHALHFHGHSPLHRLAPEVKVAGLLVFVVAVVATPPQAVWAFAAYAGMEAWAVAQAKLPAGFVLRRMLVEVPFVLFALALPLVGGGARLSVIGLSLSIEGLWGMWSVLAKGTIGVAASVILVSTTEVTDILRGLERLRVPAVVVAIAGFMIRYLDVIAGEMRRMRIAMAARGYDPAWIGQTRALAISAGSLFVRSYERGERVHQAMMARGFTGRMPDQGGRSSARWWPAMIVPAMAWLVAVGGMVTS